MRKKKLKLALAVAIIAGMFLVACGGAGDKAPAPLDPDGGEVTAELLETVKFTDEMSKIEEDVFQGLFNIEEESVKAFWVYESTGATAEELAVVRVNDKADGEKVKSAFLDRIESQKDGFENYVPEELVKLESPLIYQLGDLVIMVVADDVKAAEDMLEGYTK